MNVEAKSEHFQQTPPIPGGMEHPDYRDAIIVRLIENQYILKAINRPFSQTR
jgi:hypothetical protein